jgi:uncharacterized membrane protein
VTPDPRSAQRQPTPRVQTQTLDARMDVVIGTVLMGGVLLSALLVLAALAWHWAQTGHLGAEYQIAKLNLFEFLREAIRQIVAGTFRPRLLMNLGFGALLLTPYVRVLASLLFFALVERNWKYSVFTGFVLSVLTYSLFLR